MRPPRATPIGRLALAAVAVLLVALTNPTAWGGSSRVWAPCAGVALALIAWYGLRGVLIVGLGGLLALASSWLNGQSFEVWSLTRPILLAGEALLGWQLYTRVARGSRALADPHSAVFFLLLIPGVSAGLVALLRTALPDNSTEPFLQRFVDGWLSRGLGVAIAAPPLLVALTPLLIRWGILPPLPTAAEKKNRHFHVLEEKIGRGDWAEIFGLAFASGVLGVLLTQLPRENEIGGWQMWGAPVLLVVWASLRQGVRGGSIVAAAAATMPLLVVPLPQEPLWLAQANLLAQCAVAVLVSASTTWLRQGEARYRRVVAQVPVVLYSVRVRSPGPAHRPPDAEVTLVSAASEDLLGCPPELLLGDYDRWIERVHPDDREILRAALSQLSRQAQPVTCEYRQVPRPGDVHDVLPMPVWPSAPDSTRQSVSRWVRDTMAPTFNSEGRLVGWEGVVTDITEQRVLADDLRRTTSMFHALVTHLPTGVFFIQGPSGRPSLVNARACQLLGQREDVSASLEHLVEVYRLHKPDGSSYPLAQLPVYQALRHGASAMRDDIVVHRPDGRRIPLITWAAPVYLSGHSTPDAAVWVMEDLTALHQAESARRDSEGRLRAIFDTMGEGLIVWDRHQRVLECNQAGSAILNISSEVIRGKTVAELPWSYLREDGTALSPQEVPVQIVFRTGRPVRNFILGFGETTPPEATPRNVRWVLVNAMPLGQGSPVAVILTFSDITAYRQTQETMRVSEEKYRGLVESLPLMLVQLDRDKNFTYLNPAAQRITGFALHEMGERRSWPAQVDMEDFDRLQELEANALAGLSSHAELRFSDRAGEEKVAYLLCTPRHQGDAIVGLTYLGLDVTRERRLEHDLQRAQRLELVGRLSSGIAHDFNNLLSVILGLSEIARGGLTPDHAAYADLERISQTAEQAARLANQLLAFSKNRRIPLRRIEINELVRRTLQLLHGTLPPRIEVAAELDGEWFVQGDDTQLTQVLMNLCLNARDAMPEGGRLLLQTEAVRCPDAAHDCTSRWLRLSVTDQGQGIARPILERIFDPFYSTKERGTGLGLAVVQQIVESIGGRVQVESEPGQGACFRVWLPLCESGVMAAAANLDPVAMGN